MTDVLGTNKLPYYLINLILNTIKYFSDEIQTVAISILTTKLQVRLVFK